MTVIVPGPEPGALLDESGIPRLRAAEEPGNDLRTLLHAYERSLILAALASVGGRQRSAAALLKMLPSTLHERMKRLGIRSHRAQRVAGETVDEVCAAFRWKGRVAPGGTVELRGLNGPVRVEPAADGEVEVTAVRKGQRALLASVEIRVVEHGRGVTVCAVCQGASAPVPRRAGPPLARGLAGVRVDLVARVPPDVHVVASTVNDDIEIVGLAGNVEAGTANGRVRFLPAPAAPPLALVPTR